MACYRQCVKRKPDFVEAWFCLARCLLILSEGEAALSCLEKAVSAQPANVDILLKAAGELLGRERGEWALKFLEQALALAPEDPRLLEAKAGAWSFIGDFEQAAVWAERALELAPSLSLARNVRAGVFYKMGDAASALEHYSLALQHQPGADFIWSNKLFMMNYLEMPPTQQCEEHKQWGEFFLRKYQAQRPRLRNVLDAERRLRLGYVSPDFRQHSVAYFIAPVLLAHDRGACEVYCYSNVLKPDKFTERIKSFDVVWRDISAVGDAAAAALIAADQIDILIDLAGHTSHNRLPIFALQPAPVQITYLGYPATTGLETIAYRLTDSLADPPGMTEHLYVERLLRLDPCFLCYNPLKDAPAPSPPPAVKRGAITFGSFNNIAKVSDACIALWADVLRAVPGATLLLKNEGLSYASARDNILRRFAGRGIEEQRLRLVGHMPNILHHLAAYEEIDIALDTWPYHGTTTTCEALWMGVPVITLAGNIHAARVGVSLLTNAGLAELVAQTPEQYVALAVSLAADQERLAHLRQEMRARLSKSPLLDMKSFTRRLEDAYRVCWRDYCLSAAAAKG
ncbi:MAG: glycosyltransferase [Planctomycetota bacterium]|nr:glycosyltransferase [Planctomycetota bacterium]